MARVSNHEQAGLLSLWLSFETRPRGRSSG
jgi:hypothetical protein